MRNLRISCTSERSLKQNNFRKPGLRFTDTPANLSKVNENTELHLHKRPQQITLRRHDDINIVTDHE